MTVDSLRVESGVVNGDISLYDLDNNTARTDRTQVKHRQRKMGK